jgi:hypothetical protein
MRSSLSANDGAFRRCCLCPSKSRFPETETDSGGDSFESGTPLDVNLIATDRARFTPSDIDPKRKAILQRDGEPRAYRFRFRQPAMQPFVLMKGMDIISVDVKRALSSPEQPDLFPAGSDQPS